MNNAARKIEHPILGEAESFPLLGEAESLPHLGEAESFPLLNEEFAKSLFCGGKDSSAPNELLRNQLNAATPAGEAESFPLPTVPSAPRGRVRAA